MNQLFEGLGFSPADILLPRGCDMGKWSVVACDQYTGQPEYWEDVGKIVGDAPSALRLMLPEIYLGDRQDERIGAINAAMKRYLDGGLFRELSGCFVYVERKVHNGRVRRGLVGAVDLEQYDYHSGSGSPVRATEGTVLSRIPPRVRVRGDAPLEMPHVMLLIDDPGRTVIEPVSKRKENLEKLYDFELMKGGGHIAGWRVGGGELSPIAKALSGLADRRAFERKYGRGAPLLAYAVGDGNHSLATAKACYEKIKARLPLEAALAHPARYALVELVNIHDQALAFEPIHRVVYDVEPKKLLDAFFAFYPSARKGEGPGHRVEYAHAGGSGVITCEYPQCALAVGFLQNFLDDFVSNNGGKIDYIHGGDIARRLGSQPGAMAFLLPAMEKSQLFGAVIKDGALPRKTFSMGEACEKRFYLECRKIR